MQHEYTAISVKRGAYGWRVPSDPGPLKQSADHQSIKQTLIIMKHIAFLFALTTPAILLGACAIGPSFDGRVSHQSRPMSTTEVHENLAVADHTLGTFNNLMDTIGRFR